MATTNKNLNQPATGSASWDAPLNSNFGYTDLAFGGITTLTINSGDSSRSLTSTEYQPMTINFVSGTGTRSANITYSIPSGVGGTWMVFNNASGVMAGFSLIIASSTGGVTVPSVTIPTGGPYIVTCNTTTGMSIAQSIIIDGSITTSKIADGSITTTKLATSSNTTTGVTYAKMQYLSATSLLLGRKTAGTGNVEELTMSQALDFVGSTQGQIIYRGSSTWTPLGVGTSGQVLTTGGVAANPSWTNRVTLGTPVTTTSGPQADFTGIPSTARVIFVAFNGVSTNASGHILIQIGSASGGIESSGYSSLAMTISGSGTAANGSAAGFSANLGSADTSAAARIGLITIANLSGNTWTVTGSLYSGVFCTLVTGSKTISSTLDRVRVTTDAGDTFDGGTINVSYI
jgi:hypothetical protein